MNRYEDWIRRVAVQANPGATDEALHAFESHTGLALLPELRGLYAAADGAELPGGLRIVPLAEVEDLAELLDTAGGVEGYLPLADRDDASPYCVCTNPPLAGRVVRVPADDAPRLLFRGLDAFLAAVERAGAEGRVEDHAEYSLTRQDQTAEDDALARELIGLARECEPEDPERTDLLRFAAVLLRPDAVGELAALLDEDVHVRADAVVRLEALGATEVVARHRADLAEFTAAVADALRQAGVAVAGVEGEEVRLEPGGSLDAGAWFGRRGETGLLAEVVEHARGLADLER